MSENLNVIFEDNHLLVLNKPALLPTMGVDAKESSLIAAAKNYLKQKYNKPGNVYVGVVSRLDAFVSGVIVLARTSKAAARLNRQFAQRTTTKIYWALVPGEIRPKQTLRHWLFKDESRHAMVAVDDRQHQLSRRTDAKEASLQYQSIGKARGWNLVEVQLQTGRKHQIRVQFAAIGNSIVGDKKYGSTIAFPRGIALHSRSLQIEHPVSAARLTFTAPVPDYWNIDRLIDDASASH